MTFFLIVAAAVILAGGTTFSIAASVISSSSGQYKGTGILSRLPVPAAPRQFLGSGLPSESPVYYLMWSAIYTLCIVSSVFLLVAGLTESVIPESHGDVCFNGATCLGSALIVTAVWPMTYNLSDIPRHGRHLVWPLWMAVTIVAVAGFLGLWGLAIYQPSLRGEAAITLMVGLPWSFFTGWLLVATSVGIAIAYTAENHSGVDEVKPGREPETWFGPLITTGTIAVLSISYGEPFLSLPSIAYTLFLKLDWRHGLAMAAAAVGLIGGLIRVALN